jgi:hypothetical protein
MYEKIKYIVLIAFPIIMCLLSSFLIARTFNYILVKDKYNFLSMSSIINDWAFFYTTKTEETVYKKRDLVNPFHFDRILHSIDSADRLYNRKYQKDGG